MGPNGWQTILLKDSSPKCPNIGRRSLWAFHSWSSVSIGTIWALRAQIADSERCRAGCKRQDAAVKLAASRAGALGVACMHLQRPEKTRRQSCRPQSAVSTSAGANGRAANDDKHHHRAFHTPKWRQPHRLAHQAPRECLRHTLRLQTSRLIERSRQLAASLAAGLKASLPASLPASFPASLAAKSQRFCDWHTSSAAAQAHSSRSTNTSEWPLGVVHFVLTCHCFLPTFRWLAPLWASLCGQWAAEVRTRTPRPKEELGPKRAGSVAQHSAHIRGPIWAPKFDKIALASPLFGHQVRWRS